MRDGKQPLQEQIRTALCWLGFASAKVRCALSNTGMWSVLSPSHFGNISRIKSSNGSSRRSIMSMFFLLLRFSKSSVFVSRFVSRFTVEANSTCSSSSDAAAWSSASSMHLVCSDMSCLTSATLHFSAVMARLLSMLSSFSPNHLAGVRIFRCWGPLQVVSRRFTSSGKNVALLRFWHNWPDMGNMNSQPLSGE